MGQSPQMKKLFLLAREVGLNRDERIELSCYILRRDVRSWKDLDEVQVRRMLDALEGAQLVRSLFDLRV